MDREGMTVLVVDDNDAYRADLVDFLGRQKGIQIIGEARDGMDAVAKAQSLRPDLVMMDISMPRLGGLEATKRIKELRPETKVVFVTIHEEQTYQILADFLHADGFVCKSSAKRDIPRVLHRLTQAVAAR